MLPNTDTKKELERLISETIKEFFDNRGYDIRLGSFVPGNTFHTISTFPPNLSISQIHHIDVDTKCFCTGLDTHTLTM